MDSQVKLTLGNVFGQSLGRHEYPSELRRLQTEAEKIRKSPRKTAEFYDKDAFARCVKRACRKAGLPAGFTPNALRHPAATRVRRLYGLDGAQVVLGHKHATITEVYAEQSRKHAREITAKIG
ncbi:MAG: tyrosine-type recombinase/integrase [Tepidisphaeraceae bacterium]